MMLYKFLNILITFFISSFGFGQNKFSVSIHFPRKFTNPKAELSYDNGITERTVRFILTHNTITIADSFYSKFATVEIRIDSNNLNLPGYNLFYIGKKPASITFKNRNSATANSIKSFVLINAYDVMNMGGNELSRYTSVEQKTISEIWSRSDVADSIDDLNRIAQKRLLNKKLEFISNHKGKYYSFWLFRKEIAPNFFMDPDSSLHFYKTNFPPSVRNSLEGKEVSKILYGRKIGTSEGLAAPNFKVTDIHGKSIKLQDYKGKYVLINFWASWCVPCVKELPAIKKMSDQYSDKLEIITNTSDEDSSAFLNAIKSYGMTNWINVYRDFDFTKKFGGVSAIPQLFLIDPDGKIIYNRNFKESDYEKLTRLNQILKGKLR